MDRYDIKLHILTVALLFSTFYFLLPNLLSSKSNLHKVDKILASTEYLYEQNYTRSGAKNGLTQVLKINFTDDTRIKISNDHKKSWKMIQAPTNIGKKVTYYLGVNTSKHWNPVEMYINNQKVYGRYDHPTARIFILLLTIGSTWFSVRSLRKIFKAKRNS